MANLKNTVVAAVRTGVVVFVGVLIPGVVGWLNNVAAWLNTDGGSPFPDPSILRTVLFAAGTAAGIALLNALGIIFQNQLGIGKTPEYTSARPAE